MIFKTSTILATSLALSIRTGRHVTAAFGMTRSLKTSAPSFATSSSRYMAAESSPYEVTENGVYIVDKMPEPLPEQLKNTYFLLRHGQVS